MTRTEADKVAESLATILDIMVKAFCGHPNEVLIEYETEAVRASPAGARVHLTLRTNESDAPRVIGSGGRMIESIRTVIASAGRNANVLVNIHYANDSKDRRPVKP